MPGNSELSDGGGRNMVGGKRRGVGSTDRASSSSCGIVGWLVTRTPVAMGLDASRACAVVLCKYWIQRRAASIDGSACSASMKCCIAGCVWPFLFSR